MDSVYEKTHIVNTVCRVNRLKVNMAYEVNNVCTNYLFACLQHVVLHMQTGLKYRNHTGMLSALNDLWLVAMNIIKHFSRKEALIKVIYAHIYR